MKFRVHILVSKTSLFLLSVQITMKPNKTKIPMAVISENSDHSRIAVFICTSAIVNELKKRMKELFKKVILWSAGCSSALNACLY